MTRHLVDAEQQLATIEVTNLAPTPARDRVRSRAAFTGSLASVGVGTSDNELFAVLDVLSAELVTSGQTLTVDQAALATSRPDPLAAIEGGGDRPGTRAGFQHLDRLSALPG